MTTAERDPAVAIFARHLRERVTPWEPADRPPLEPHQIPPDPPWSLWLLMAGRGAGKTEACARYFARWMREHPGHRGRIIAPTLGDAVEACVDGPSGLRAMDPEIRFLPSSPGGAKVIWPNGSEALLIGTPTPRDTDRLRASGNRHIDWWEEMAANPQLDEAWAQAAFGLRLGERPHSIASTTPRPTKALRERIADESTVVTRGKMADNPHLPDVTRKALEDRYAGTRLGRQELYGELLEDVPGALWTLDEIDRHRVERPEDLLRVVVGVDPAVTSHEESDETGIIVAGVDARRHAYVLADRSGRFTPDGWARRAVAAYEDHEADRIVGEVNNGGEMIEHTLRTVAPNVSYRSVRATRGKALRAEPVAALYEQGRVHHVGVYRELEDQMTTWTPEATDSPDRLDALVWAITELGLANPPARKVKGPVW